MHERALLLLEGDVDLVPAHVGDQAQPEGRVIDHLVHGEGLGGAYLLARLRSLPWNLSSQAVAARLEAVLLAALGALLFGAAKDWAFTSGCWPRYW